jgi:serine/threonine protein kinase
MMKKPKRLGKYEILKEVGQGNMATVYMGHDPYINRDVAVKVALPEIIKDKPLSAQFKRMFFNEARIAGMLDNKFILSVYDAGVEGDLLYLVMEYIKGGSTLKDFCTPDKLLPIPKVIELIYKCCRGLAYAHSRDVIHRDIKPTNILLTEDTDVRIADFGIAQLLKGGDTQVVGVIGSPLYMSPEQISGKALTNQTDIYSLGVVLFELLTGQLPFQADTFPALYQKILHEEPPLLSALRQDIPGYLEVVIKKALAKNLATRYPNAVDFSADLYLAFKQQRVVVTGVETDRREKFERLRKVSFFTDFFDSELWEAIDAGEWQEFGPGQVIVHEGDIADSFYVIVKGSVQVMREGAALTTLKAGDCFGEMAYFSGAKRSADILATEDTIILKINSATMEKASMNCQLRFMKTFLSTLIERLSGTSARAAGKKGDEAKGAAAPRKRNKA